MGLIWLAIYPDQDIMHHCIFGLYGTMHMLFYYYYYYYYKQSTNFGKNPIMTAKQYLYRQILRL